MESHISRDSRAKSSKQQPNTQTMASRSSATRNNLWCFVTSQYFPSHVQNATEDFISAVHIHIYELTPFLFCDLTPLFCHSTSLCQLSLKSSQCRPDLRLLILQAVQYVRPGRQTRHECGPSKIRKFRDYFSCTLWQLLGTSTLPGVSDLFGLSQRVVCIFDERLQQVSWSAPTHHAKVACQPQKSV